MKESVELDERFKVGDKVKAKKGSQAGSFRQYETKVGTIVKDYKDGDFKVNFGGSNDASIAGKDLVKESVNEESRLKFGDKVKTPQGTVEIKKRDTRGMRGKQDDYEMVLHMKNGKKASMGSHPAPTASAVTNIAKRHFSKGVPSYMKTESVELDELSPSTVGSYINKRSMGDRAKSRFQQKARDARRAGNEPESEKNRAKAKKIDQGLSRAVARHHSQRTGTDHLKHKSVKRVPQAYKDRAKHGPTQNPHKAVGESVNLEEKNVPTNPALWAKMKAQAKAKFDVYPSAYANGWAAKKYKAAGGGWKTEALDPKQKAKAQKSASQKKSFKSMRNRLGESTIDENSNMAAIRKLLGGTRPMDLERASNAIKAYSKKSGGIDKKDFDLAADYLAGMGRLNDLRKVADVKKKLTMHVGQLDTDVRDKITSMLPTGLKKKV